MQLWHQFPDLAEFPGTISVGDARDEDPAYKSSNLSSADVSSIEPELSDDARAQPMRLYSQEGDVLCTSPQQIVILHIDAGSATAAATGAKRCL